MIGVALADHTSDRAANVPAETPAERHLGDSPAPLLVQRGTVEGQLEANAARFGCMITATSGAPPPKLNEAPPRAAFDSPWVASHVNAVSTGTDTLRIRRADHY